MAETGSNEQFKIVKDLMHEMVALWQRVKDLEDADRDNRLALEMLRESDARLRYIIENLPLRLFFKDAALNYVLCSETYALDWDMHAGELQGRSDHDIFSPEAADRLAAVEREVIRTGTTEIAEEDWLVSGREISVLAIRKSISDSEGNTLGLLGVLWDVTENKRHRANQERRIYELEGALSERVGQVESLRNELDKSTAEYREKEDAFGRLRIELEGELAALKEGIRSATDDFRLKEDEFSRLRTELEAQLRAGREEIHRLRNDLQKEMFERGQAVDALKRTVAHSQELLNSVQKVTGAQ